MRLIVSVALICLLFAISVPVEASDSAPAMPTTLPADNFRDVLVQAGDGLFIAGQPTEIVEQVHRPLAKVLLAIIVFVLGLGQMGVQTNAVLPRQRSTRTHQFGRHRKG